MKTHSLELINPIFILILIFSSLSGISKYSLEFNGEGDYVALNGTDIAPPWTVEVMVNKNETDNCQHLLTSTDANSG